MRPAQARRASRLLPSACTRSGSCTGDESDTSRIRLASACCRQPRRRRPLSHLLVSENGQSENQLRAPISDRLEAPRFRSSWQGVQALDVPWRSLSAVTGKRRLERPTQVDKMLSTVRDKRARGRGYACKSDRTSPGRASASAPYARKQDTSKTDVRWSSPKV
jgi:hypothetical protein